MYNLYKSYFKLFFFSNTMSQSLCSNSIASSIDNQNIVIYEGMYEPYYRSIISDDETATTRSDYVNKYAEKTERKGHHVFKIEIPDQEFGVRKIKISAFETFPYAGGAIVNAVTGIPYMKDEGVFYRYGSKDELELFKVKDVSRPSKGGFVFFYDSPEQYERHMHRGLRTNVKETWHKRMMN